MALRQNMSSNKMIDFLDQELLPQVRLEVRNWIKPSKKQGGYFVTVRQIFCMVDFLGAVYGGYPKKERQAKEKIAKTQKAIEFITTFFEPKKTYNEDIVTKLYSMYRHGLVHLYQPKILKYKSNCTLEWFFYKGKRAWLRKSANTNKGRIVFKNVDHLKIIPRGRSKTRYNLAVCINALYEDFENAVLNYRHKLKNTMYLQTNWRTTVNAILEPQ